MKNKHNDILITYNQYVRVVEYQSRMILLSNGVVVNGKKDVAIFNRRIKKAQYVSNFDKIYDTNDDERQNILKELKSNACKLGGIRCQELHKDKIKDNLNDGTPWNKGISTNIEPWNKGLTKNDDDRLLKLSIDRKGEGNPMFGVVLSEETKKKQSDSIKQTIKNGDFTPNIHNSHTHWQVEYNGRKYRSSWEAFFHHFNQEYEYETLRIPYNLDGKDRIYIVDFINHNTKHVVELKPRCKVNGKTELVKEESLSIWCDIHGYTYTTITEDYILDNLCRLDDGVFDKETTRKLNETRKKN